MGVITSEYHIFVFIFNFLQSVQWRSLDIILKKIIKP